MSGRDPSESVAAPLESLYEAHEGFDVSQTTVAVGPEEFAAVAERGGVTEVRVEVEGSDGLLAVANEGEWIRPGGVVEGERPLSVAAEELVRRQTGVECSVEELHRVALVCLQCEASEDEAWELRAIFGAAVESGAPTAGAAWCDGFAGGSRTF
jgi:ADP-ribose pyrophosphatase YjhB (NUDIX family)